MVEDDLEDRDYGEVEGEDFEEYIINFNVDSSNPLRRQRLNDYSINERNNNNNNNDDDSIGEQGI